MQPVPPTGRKEAGLLVGLRGSGDSIVVQHIHVQRCFGAFLGDTEGCWFGATVKCASVCGTGDPPDPTGLGVSVIAKSLYGRLPRSWNKPGLPPAEKGS